MHVTIEKNLETHNMVLLAKNIPEHQFFASLFVHLCQAWHLVTLSMTRVSQCYYKTNKQEY